MTTDQQFIRRTFQLARLGEGRTSPNPMVGAVLVFQNRIIGEGYHQRYGGAHAEVNAVASVIQADQQYIPYSTLYVSLEPCCIFGKTPPCTNLILEKRIPKVVVSCLDQTPEVSGMGIQILRAAGVEVITGVLEEEGKLLAAPRNIFVQKKRPYVILKMAVTPNGFFAPDPPAPFWITHDWTKRLVHRWRAEADAILVGATTAQVDNPELTNRLYSGKSPLRVVLDHHSNLSPELHLFSDGMPTLAVVNHLPTEQKQAAVSYFEHQGTASSVLPDLLAHLYQLKKSILLVEGGATVLNEFIKQGLWDEARVITGQNWLTNGIPAPTLPVSPEASISLGSDQLRVFRNPANR
jgi:diaminohydroxyphosphoribosylaminopyrimidine deaminase/5-amino-6-(5-phosphoribosylamino)uracil reductase